MIRVCFICLGNICRSPTAEAVFIKLVNDRGLAAQFEIDSAGTGDWHAGEEADSRSRAAARARGVHITSRARQVAPKDFERFDHLIVMDRSNRANLLRIAPSAEAAAKVRLFREFEAGAPPEAEVPDPYSGGAEGFEEVLDMSERAAVGLLEFLLARSGPALEGNDVR